MDMVREIRMSTSFKKRMVLSASLLATLLAGASAATAATTVNLTAQRASAAMPDGAAIPMWQYCLSASQPAGNSGVALGAACGGAWTPGPTIIVPVGDTLNIALTNALPVPTSITILGQLGGGLGTPVTELSPAHNAVNTTTWMTNTTAAKPFTPPLQGPRARTFGAETASNATATYTWNNLKPGTYLYETATHPSLQAPMGLYGVLIVTTAPAASTTTPTTLTPGTAFAAGVLNGVQVSAVQYDADATFLISEVDPVQNAAVDAAVSNSGFLGETIKWTSACGAAHTCYPPAVNYAPTYILLNGQPFDANNPGANAAQPQILGTPSGTLFTTGNLMLRVVNAGLRTHVPSLVGMPLQQIAEDGHRAPGATQSVSELLMTAGKTRDVLIQPSNNGNPAASPAVLPSAYTEKAYGFFDRALGLSTNERPNGGAQGYLAVVNAASLSPTGGLNAWLGAAGGKPAVVAAAVNPDTFTLPGALHTYTNNVLANDVGIYSAAVQTPPSAGTVVMNTDGTFTYTSASTSSVAPTAGTLIDSFKYCGNGSTTLCTTVQLVAGGGAAPVVTATNDTYTSRVATLFRAWAGEGVLANDVDSQGFPLAATLAAPSSCATLNSDGSFVATSGGGGTCTFSYVATDSQGVKSAAASVTVNFPTGSGLTVAVQDALGIQQNAGQTSSTVAASTALTDYMWLIEEDPTFHTVPGVTPPAQNNNPGLTISNSFHVSHTNIVAAGCTGPLSCGDAQKYSSASVPGAPRSSPGDVALDPTKHYFISVLPGDAGNAFIAGLSADPTVAGNCTFSNTNVPNVTAGKSTDCGHTIGGAMVAPGQTQVSVLVDPNPLKPAQLSVIAFEDNNPVNGDLDDGETGLGGFNVVIFDAAGRSGDPAGQITYDAFNMPLTNWLLGKPGCPNEENPTVQNDPALSAPAAGGANSLVGAIYTCPDGHRNITGISPVTNGGGHVVRFVISTAAAHHFLVGTPVDFSGIGSALFNATLAVRSCPESNATTFCISPPAGAANAAVTVGKGASVRDPATYSLAGHALVKNIMPGRFDVLMHPGAQRQGDGETWIQVSTLEGTPANDAFARAGEPAYFQEFGPPGYHAFVGWMNPDRVKTINTLVGNGNTVKGRVTNLHMSRPSAIFNYDSTTRDPLKSSVCFVGLNTTGGNGATAGFAKCDDQGNFTLTNVPYGSHQIVVWDQWLDQIIAYFNVNVTPPAPPATPTPVTIDMGEMPVLSWFTMVQENAFVYNDAGCPALAIRNNTTQSGLQAALNQCAQSPLAQIPITIRYRDGSISNLLLTDSNGNATFNELFPLFNWYVAEVDQTRYAPLTAHVVVDGGGQPDCTTFNPTTGGSTASYSAGCTTGGMAPGAVNSKYPTGESTEHTYTAGELYFGLQGFISQTEKIDWGKTVLPPGANGGFSGVVVYGSTRGYDDPRLEVQFKWEPAVPRVPVRLYQKVTAPDGTTTLKLVAMTTTTSWDDVAAGAYATTDGMHNLLGLPKPNCPGQVASDPYVPQVLGSDVTRCYDGFHNWNQVQPLTYDGYYQLPTLYPSGINPDGTPIVANEAPIPVPNGQYVIEIVPPPGYEVVKEEDKNILIGDAWVAPAAQQFAALGNIFILPDQATISSAYNLNGPGSLQSALDFDDGKPQLPLCAGTLHRVPDFLSLFPQSGQVAPFAGADRPLCDRKDVQIMAGQNGTANFFVFSNTPRASKFTGIILDDASAEFNVAAPDFGEKFGVPYVAVSIRDQYGVEIERLYGDQWGGYNGMTPSTWQVNVPNPAGYSPNMLITCMNDPGPITVNGVVQIDPQYMPTYSNFCYTNPFMPGLTTYLDTPVLPVGAFASNYVSGYNPVDCAYPDTTPAISRVDGDSIGPWLSPAGSRTLKIKALGALQVPNAAYLGPSQTAAPYNSKTVARTYNFVGGRGKVMLGTIDISAGITSWTDNEIDVVVPASVANGAYELGVINTNGKSSVDTVTVTIERARAANGLTPASPRFVAAPSNSVTSGGASHVVQAAIDAAKPGDLIILDAGVYNELVVMWKPVRLQGVGAASVIINAAKYPTDKLEAWRPTINSLFGVDTISGNAVTNPQVDPLPGQEITGGIVFLEPSVLATEEGAGITVLAKDQGSHECDDDIGFSSYYDSTQLRTVNGVQQGTIVKSTRKIRDSWFACAKSRIDGISVTGGDAGGGVYVNGYAHNLEIANNRVYGNAGAFGGGIRIGVPHLETQDLATIQEGYDNNVNIHHNSITQNGLIEASGAVGGTPGASGAGAGLSLCTGTNNYKAHYNFICGNYSSSDGGGIGHIGYSRNGSIAHNTVLFNQSFFQQSATNGGGIAIEGEAPVAGGVSLGAGSVTVDANLVQGNFAEGGHGGGIALMQVNGSDRICGEDGCSYRNSVKLTNNEIVDNVAGWSAGGLYLLDSFNVAVINNTVAMNDSVGIAGPLFNGGNNGKPNPAGIAADATSPALLTLGAPAYSSPRLTNNIIWHNRSFYGNLSGTLSPPNNVGLQGTAGPYYSKATLCASNDGSNVGSGCVTLTTALSSGATALSTLASGQCDAANERYWDLGLVGDARAVPGANKLNPQYSVLSSTMGYANVNAHNTANDPQLVKPYCNSAQALSASSDEQGNFVDFRYGPLSQTAPVTYTGTAAGAFFGNYGLASSASSAFNTGSANGAPALDFLGTTRPQAGLYDIGAVELIGTAGAAPVAPGAVRGVTRTVR
jgi:FtsP/CotA-like multicopper oxidase with cupredoxin domain